jgi:SAM-dependent methyltransferase
MSDALARRHFDAIAGTYAGATGALDPLYAAVAPVLDAALAGKEVLDVGSGGVFPFDRRVAASVTALDLSPEMLARVPAGVAAVVGDARDMSGLEDASFDAVLFSLSFHHIAEESLAGTEAAQAAALKEAFRVLRPGGRLFLFEPVLSPALFALERVLHPLVSALFGLAGVPPVYFRSRASLKRLADFEAFVPRVAGWVDPLSGTFPSRLRLPVALFPTRYELFEARKPRG